MASRSSIGLAFTALACLVAGLGLAFLAWVGVGMASIPPQDPPPDVDARYRIEVQQAQARARVQTVVGGVLCAAGAGLAVAAVLKRRRER